MTRKEFIQWYCIENSNRWSDDYLVTKSIHLANELERRGIPFDEEEAKPQETIVNIDEQ